MSPSATYERKQLLGEFMSRSAEFFSDNWLGFTVHVVHHLDRQVDCTLPILIIDRHPDYEYTTLGPETTAAGKLQRSSVRMRVILRPVAGYTKMFDELREARREHHEQHILLYVPDDLQSDGDPKEVHWGYWQSKYAPKDIRECRSPGGRA